MAEGLVLINIDKREVVVTWEGDNCYGWKVSPATSTALELPEFFSLRTDPGTHSERHAPGPGVALHRSC